MNAYLHTPECIERCLSESTPRMDCRGCSAEYVKARHLYLSAFTTSQIDQIIAIEAKGGTNVE